MALSHALYPPFLGSATVKKVYGRLNIRIIELNTKTNKEKKKHYIQLQYIDFIYIKFMIDCLFSLILRICYFIFIYFCKIILFVLKKFCYIYMNK